jgi:hypothetical protein
MHLLRIPYPMIKRWGSVQHTKLFFATFICKILTQKLESIITLYKIDSNLISLGKRAGYFL